MKDAVIRARERLLAAWAVGAVAKPTQLELAKTGLLAAPPSTKPVSLPVVVNLKQDGEWKLASTEDWPCDPRFRKYLVAYMSPRSRQLVFHSLSELAKAEE